MRRWATGGEHSPFRYARERPIAEDEIRHAALAWAVAEWVTPQLDPEARDRVQAAREGALARLSEAYLSAAPRALVEAGLLPDHPAACNLLTALARTIQSALS